MERRNERLRKEISENISEKTVTSDIQQASVTRNLRGTPPCRLGRLLGYSIRYVDLRNYYVSLHLSNI